LKAQIQFSAHHLAAALRNQPRRALIAGVDPKPTERDTEPVTQADQKIDMGDTPYPPRKRAAQLDPSEIDHRLAFADLRQAAGVIGRRVEPFGSARSAYAGGPDQGLGFQRVASVHDALGVAFGDWLSQHDFDAESFKRPLRVS